MKRLAVAIASLVLITAISLAQSPPRPGAGGPPSGSTTPGGPPAANMPPGGPPGMGQGQRGGFAPPPFPGDSTAAERDSLMNEVLKSIAGKEQMPAESVFKDIQVLKGRPAGSIPRVMNYGFGRSLGASCFHCHAKNDWAKSEKKQKRIAREMFRMVQGIDSLYISKIDGLGDPAPAGGPPGRRPTVNCSTCHRGSIRTNPDMPRPGGPPPGGH